MTIEGIEEEIAAQKMFEEQSNQCKDCKHWSPQGCMYGATLDNLEGCIWVDT